MVSFERFFVNFILVKDALHRFGEYGEQGSVFQLEFNEFLKFNAVNSISEILFFIMIQCTLIKTKKFT